MADDLTPDLGAPAPDVAPDTAPVADSAPADAAPAPEATPEPDSFSREYVQELRREAQGYREKFVPFRDAFDGYADEDREFLLDIARTAKEDPARAAELMRTAAEQLAAAGQPPAPPEFDPYDPDSLRQFIQAEAKNLYQSEKSAEAQQQSVEALNKQVVEMGYAEGSPEYMALLWSAHNEHGGDIQKAHEVREQARQAERQKVIDEYLAGKAGAANGMPQPTPQTGGAAPASETPKDFGQARAAVNARLAAKYGPQS